MKEIYNKQIGEFRIIAIDYSDGEVEQLISKAKENIKNFINNMESSDFYVGSEKDVAVGMLLTQHLRQELGYPFLDCEAHEENGYGLPEFSVYYNQDARSWCGKWTYSESFQSIDEGGVFFALIGSTNPCYGKVKETVNKLLQKGNVALTILTPESK
jgi:hypothetical protein